jgi:hypothetical protein
MEKQEKSKHTKQLNLSQTLKQMYIIKFIGAWTSKQANRYPRLSGKVSRHTMTIQVQKASEYVTNDVSNKGPKGKVNKYDPQV